MGSVLTAETSAHNGNKITTFSQSPINIPNWRGKYSLTVKKTQYCRPQVCQQSSMKVKL